MPMASRAPVGTKNVSTARAESLIEELVRIPSLSGEERRAVEFLTTEMSAMGFEASIDEAGNAVGSRTGVLEPGAEMQEIVLLGHIDTFPGAPVVRREGDVLFGRGSVDAKGPLATFVVAVANLPTIPVNTRITVIGAVEEESASSKGARHASRMLRPAACIIGEPSRWDGITLGYKGRALVRYSLERSCSHSAGPEQSPPDSMVQWWGEVCREVAALTPAAKGIFDRVQASLRTVNTSGDGLHDTVTAIAGFRLPPGVSGSQIDQICRRHANGGAIEISGMELAHVEPRSSPVASALSSAIRAAGGTPRPQVKTGTADFNVVAPTWRCPIAAYGPGDSSLDHTPHEHLSMQEFHRAIAVLEQAIPTLAASLKNP